MMACAHQGGMCSGVCLIRLRNSAQKYRSIITGPHCWVLSTHYVDPEKNLISLLLKKRTSVASFDDIYLIYYSHKYLETTRLSYSIVLLSLN